MYDEKYGSVEIDGKKITIEDLDIDDLNKYMKKLENERAQLIEQQNDYLSKIIV